MIALSSKDVWTITEVLDYRDSSERDLEAYEVATLLPPGHSLVVMRGVFKPRENNEKIVSTSNEEWVIDKLLDYCNYSRKKPKKCEVMTLLRPGQSIVVLDGVFKHHEIFDD